VFRVEGLRCRVQGAGFSRHLGPRTAMFSRMLSGLCLEALRLEGYGIKVTVLQALTSGRGRRCSRGCRSTRSAAPRAALARATPARSARTRPRRPRPASPWRERCQTVKKPIPPPLRLGLFPGGATPTSQVGSREGHRTQPNTTSGRLHAPPSPATSVCASPRGRRRSRRSPPLQLPTCPRILNLGSSGLGERVI